MKIYPPVIFRPRNSKIVNYLQNSCGKEFLFWRVSTRNNRDLIQQHLDEKIKKSTPIPSDEKKMKRQDPAGVTFEWKEKKMSGVNKMRLVITMQKKIEN